MTDQQWQEWIKRQQEAESERADFRYATYSAIHAGCVGRVYVQDTGKSFLFFPDGEVKEV